MSLGQRELEWVSFLEGDSDLDQEEEEEDIDSPVKKDILAFKVQQHHLLPKLKIRQIIQDVFVTYCNKYPTFSTVFGNHVPIVAILKNKNISNRIVRARKSNVA